MCITLCSCIFLPPYLTLTSYLSTSPFSCASILTLFHHPVCLILTLFPHSLGLTLYLAALIPCRVFHILSSPSLILPPIHASHRNCSPLPAPLFSLSLSLLLPVLHILLFSSSVSLYVCFIMWGQAASFFLLYFCIFCFVHSSFVLNFPSCFFFLIGFVLLFSPHFPFLFFLFSVAFVLFFSPSSLFSFLLLLRHSR